MLRNNRRIKITLPAKKLIIELPSSSSESLIELPEFLQDFLPKPKDLRCHLYNALVGVMLADHYFTTKSINKTRNSDSKGIVDPTGWLWSEKFDGVRAVWDGEKFISRGGQVWSAPEWFKDKMPNIPLDGELYIKRNYFHRTSGICRKKIPIDSEWKQIKFMVFDIPLNSLSTTPFELRTIYLKHIITTLKSSDPTTPLIFIEQKIVVSHIDLCKKFWEIRENQSEGIVIRNPKGCHVIKRSKDFLKLKEDYDEEAIIVGYEGGKNKHKGKLGSLHFKWRDPEKVQEKFALTFCPDFIVFKTGSGLTDIQRPQMDLAHIVYPYGTVATINFMELQESGKPRQPTFKGVRVEQDLPK